MPPSLLVSDRGELVHSFGGASRFLRMRDGRQGLDVLDVVDGELRVVLVGGLKRALAETSAIVFKGVRLEGPGGSGTYKVTLRRVRGRVTAVPHVLVSFEPMEGAEPAPGRAEMEIDLDQASRQQIGALEAELSHTKENLQAAIEELEASNARLFLVDPSGHCAAKNVTAAQVYSMLDKALDIKPDPRVTYDLVERSAARANPAYDKIPGPSADESPQPPPQSP